MRVAFVIFCLFLAIEGMLAWQLSGNSFLITAAGCGLLGYAIVCRLRSVAGEGARILASGLIAIAGPLYYKGQFFPTIMCFLALPHLLAATQCLWELTWSAEKSAVQSQRMRGTVFTVAFYAALGLVFMLLRGAEPVLSGWSAIAAAAAVLMLSLPAWDMARLMRIKPGQSVSTLTGTGRLARLLLVIAALAGVATIFNTLLPPLAEQLCAVSPRWRADLPAPASEPPRRPHEPPPEIAAGQGPVRRPGLDSSSVSAQHRLPQAADLQSTGDARLFVQCADPREAASLAAAGPVYVRSHAFDVWREGAWSPAVRGGVWLEDSSDGAVDGWVTLEKAVGRPIEHTVFHVEANGFTLPALHGVSAYQLPRVFSIPGGTCQLPATGDLKYTARGVPNIFEQLPEPQRLKEGAAPLPVHATADGTDVIHDLLQRNPDLRPKSGVLADRIAAIKRWMVRHVRYSTRVTGAENLLPLDNFLIGERRGYCDFYATAGCLLLREQGVPARIAYGYATREYDPQGNVFVFTDENAHAWAEVFLDGRGWTLIEFTPAEHVGGPAQPPPAAQRAAFNPDKFNFAGDDKSNRSKPTEKPKSFGDHINDFVSALGGLNLIDFVQRLLPWVAAVLALSVLARALLRQQRQRKGRDGKLADDDRQPVYFAELIRVCTAAGFPRPAGSTPREFLNYLKHNGVIGVEWRPMIAYHYSLRYENAPVDSSGERQFMSEVKALAARLSSSRALPA